MVQVPLVEPQKTDQDIRLHEAARSGEIRNIEVLISEGLDVNSADANGHTPLIFAAMAGKADVVKELLKKGADPSIKDSMGHDAFSSAMFFGDFRGMTVPPFDEILKLIDESRAR